MPKLFEPVFTVVRHDRQLPYTEKDPQTGRLGQVNKAVPSYSFADTTLFHNEKVVQIKHKPNKKLIWQENQLYHAERSLKDNQ